MFASFAIGLAAAAASANLPPPPQRAQPRVPLASYVSADDYPASAQRLEEEGMVVFDLVVGPDGRVINCTVTGSSGSSALDNASCRIMRSRARFTPARDADGNPVADSGRAALTWWLPAGVAMARPWAPSATGVVLPNGPALVGRPPIEPPRARANLASYVSHGDYPRSAWENNEQGTVGFTLAVGADGRVTDCRATRSSGSAALDNATCRIMRSRARFTPARDSTGNPIAGSVQSQISWFIR